MRLLLLYSLGAWFLIDKPINPVNSWAKVAPSALVWATRSRFLRLILLAPLPPMKPLIVFKKKIKQKRYDCYDVFMEMDTHSKQQWSPTSQSSLSFRIKGCGKETPETPSEKERWRRSHLWCSPPTAYGKGWLVFRPLFDFCLSHIPFNEKFVPLGQSLFPPHTEPTHWPIRVSF